jgi:hypothetical protein
MAWLAFLLTVFITLAHLGDFLFGDSLIYGTRTLVYKLYIRLSEDWRSIYQVPALVMNRFFNAIFRVNRGKWVAFLAIVIYSLLVSLILSSMICLYIVLSRYTFASSKFITYVAKVYFGSAPGAVVGDLVVWPVAISLLSVTSHRGPLTAIICTVMMLCWAYVSVAAMLTIAVLATEFEVIVLGDGPSAIPLFVSLLPDAVSVFGPAFLHTVLYIPFIPDPAPGLIQQVFQACLPVLTFSVLAVILAIFYPMRFLLQSPILFILARIEAYPKSFFMLVAGLLSSLVTLLAAWIKVGTN